MKRQAYRAGSFYEADEGACRRAAADFIDQAVATELPEALYGGLVPHAGWMFSARTAAAALKALASRDRLARVVIFGADHWGIGGSGGVYDAGAWETPLGEVAIDGPLASALLRSVPGLRADPSAHAREHSIEVQLPLMRVLNEGVKVVPIAISPQAEAVEVGRAVGRVLASDFPDASVIGSTDLTHYGPQYGFTPGGGGDAGLEWAKENDARVMKLVEAMRVDEVLTETAARQNACGGGAIAATMAAAAAMGATRGICLEYTSSAEVMRKLRMGLAEDAVGYAAVVFA